MLLTRSLSWHQIQLKTGLNVRNLSRILSAGVNVFCIFLYFALNKLKSTLTHLSVFFTCGQELFPYEVVANDFIRKSPN